MQSHAYLSAFFYRYLVHPTMFPISLIAYDKIYVNVDFNDIPWNRVLWERRDEIENGDIDKETLEKVVEYEKEKGQEKKTDWWASSLAHYLQWDYRNLKDLDGVLLDLKLQGPKQTQSFLSRKLRQPYYEGRPVYLDLLNYWIRSYWKLTYGDLYADDTLDHISAETIANEFFTIRHLIKRTSIFPILTYTELDVMRELKHFPIILPEPQNEKERKWWNGFARYMTRELKRNRQVASSLEQDTKHSVVETILDWSVPKFDDVPLREIVMFKKKDKTSSIAKLAEEIRETKKVDNIDVAKIFVDRLWEMGKTLQPSIGENLIGVLGEIPLPIPNPFGIVSAFKSALDLVKFKKEYSWFITLSEIQNKSKLNDE